MSSSARATRGSVSADLDRGLHRPGAAGSGSATRSPRSPTRSRSCRRPRAQRRSPWWRPARASDGLRTAAARAVRTAAPGQTIAWALDRSSPDRRRRAAAGGGRGCGDRRLRRPCRPPTDTSSGRRLVICGADPALSMSLDRAALVAGWCNLARELVDAPAEPDAACRPGRRADTTARRGVELVDPATAGLGGLAAVGGSSAAPPLLLVLEHRPSSAGGQWPHLALVGKGVTFDSGGLFLKGRGPRSFAKRPTWPAVRR